MSHATDRSETCAILLHKAEASDSLSSPAVVVWLWHRGLDFMVDESFGTYLLEVNTGPVLKGDDESDMRMIAGMTEMLFGTGTCSPCFHRNA